jgi:intein-encoded DNA endonuclease-like protein
MDISTGKTYKTREAALADGVAEPDIAYVERRLRDGKPVVKFSKGSFKAFRRNETGELERIGG